MNHKTICAIHQPQYLPWLGYFDKIDKADIFVFLDNVQYKKREFQNRNRIRNPGGWFWLTVPVVTKGKFDQRISEVLIDNSEDWASKHYKSIERNYCKAPFFRAYEQGFGEIYGKKWEKLSDLNIGIAKYLTEVLGLEVKFLTASSLTGLREEPTERLVDICRSVSADQYLSGRDGVKYMDMGKFKRENIEVIIQDFHHPAYRQLYERFETNLSIIDLIFNHGPKSLQILRGG